MWSLLAPLSVDALQIGAQPVYLGTDLLVVAAMFGRAKCLPVLLESGKILGLNTNDQHKTAHVCQEVCLIGAFMLDVHAWATCTLNMYACACTHIQHPYRSCVMHCKEFFWPLCAIL